MAAPLLLVAGLVEAVVFVYDLASGAGAVILEDAGGLVCSWGLRGSSGRVGRWQSQDALAPVDRNQLAG